MSIFKRVMGLPLFLFIISSLGAGTVSAQETKKDVKALATFY